MSVPDPSADSPQPHAAEPHDAERVAALAVELRVVAGQLFRRFREEGNRPHPQLAAIGWIAREGPKTTSQLAVLERVRPQSMAQTVGNLEEAGLVERRPDPSDGRQSILHLSAAGSEFVDGLRARGESWVSQAVQQRFTPEELAELERGIELLGRVAGD